MHSHIVAFVVNDSVFSTCSVGCLLSPQDRPWWRGLGICPCLGAVSNHGIVSFMTKFPATVYPESQHW
jgi:hypothetical protein